MTRNPLLVISFLLLVIMFATGAHAETAFDKVAGDITAEYEKTRETQKQTLLEISQRRKMLKEKLARLKASVSKASDTLAADCEHLKEISRKRDAMEEKVRETLSKNRELNMLFVEQARNFLALVEKCAGTNLNLKPVDTLKSWVDEERVFRLSDLKALMDLFFEDMTASREKRRYTGQMVNRSGGEAEGDIILLGHQPAMYRVGDDVGYLTRSPASGSLLMSAQPDYWERRNLRRYFEGKTNGVYTDISGGAAVMQLGQQVTLLEQLKSGGMLVLPILLVGLVALALTIERLIFLGRVRHNTDALMTRVTSLVEKGDIEGALESTRPHEKRPTGRVLMAGLAHRDDPRDVLESSLSETMLREAPRLERFVGALKVCAAVAPLLGLLGTVTGMINTFQVITTHGTGDPGLMAGGISEAMVTTQVGLAVAIPIMIVAAFLGRRARNLSQDMEEKGLALMGALLRVRSISAKETA